LNKSISLELDQLGATRNMKDGIIFISDTSFVLIIYDFFPRSDDFLGKRKAIFMCIYI
jgi:hypothetical protein